MDKQIKIIKNWMIFFMVMLTLSGLTAIPIQTGLSFLSRCFPPDKMVGAWIEKVYLGVVNSNRNYPFMAYGYDWLAFAHFILAILFIGPYRNPVRNRWVIEFGMIACLLVIPFALIADHFRGIPLWWRLIDCSFGVIGLIPLIICLKKINQVEILVNRNSEL